MLKYFLVAVVCFFALHLVFFASRKIHKSRHNASRILDAYLPDDELIAYARQLASGLSGAHKGDSMGVIETVLSSNYDYITSVHRELMERSAEESKLPPAAEWILDNYYIVERHIKEIRMGLNHADFAVLPVLDEDSRKGYPRIYTIAEAFVAHRDARVDEELLVQFIQSYQEHDTLTSPELWALPVMLKLVLIENIAYICRKIRQSVKQYEYAKKYCGYILTRASDEKYVSEKVGRYFAGGSRINYSFVIQLA